MRGLRALILGACLAIGAGHVSAQTQPVQLPSSVLIIDTEQVFSGTIYGQRIIAEVQVKTEAQNEENRQIANALTEEEQSIAARRATMTPEAFRAEADAFDEKVVAIRQAQDQKEAEIQAELDALRRAFDDDVRPILGQIMRERGATVMMGRRDVILYFGAIDITDIAIATVDAQLGDGTETSGE